MHEACETTFQESWGDWCANIKAVPTAASARTIPAWTAEAEDAAVELGLFEADDDSYLGQGTAGA